MSNPTLKNGSGSPIGIHDSSTYQYHRIGTRGQLADRSFRYYRLTNATGVVSNNLCQAAIPEANHTTETGGLGFVGSDTGGIPAGTKIIRANMGATAGIENQYEDGYIKIETATTGTGQIYKIKKHLAIEASGAGNIVTLELYDPVVTVIATGATFSLIPNPWADVIITPVTTITGLLVGVPSHAIPAASAAAPTYGWMQTWGLCSVLNQSAAGGNVIASGVVASATVGAVDVAVETEIKQRVGIAYESLATDAAYITVFLQIAP